MLDLKSCKFSGSFLAVFQLYIKLECREAVLCIFLLRCCFCAERSRKIKNVPTMQWSRFMKRPLLDPWKKPCSNVEFLSAELLKCDSATHEKTMLDSKCLWKDFYSTHEVTFAKLLQSARLCNFIQYQPPPPLNFSSLFMSRGLNLGTWTNLLIFSNLLTMSSWFHWAVCRGLLVVEAIIHV